MNDPSDPSPRDDTLDDLMDQLVFDLLDAAAADRALRKIESDPHWRAAYEAAVQRKRILTAEVRGQAQRMEPSRGAPDAQALIAAVASGTDTPEGPQGHGHERNQTMQGNADKAALFSPFSPFSPKSAWRFWVVAAAMVLLNLGGIIWIHHSLTRRAPAGPVPKLQIVQALPTDRADNADRLSLVFAQDIAAADEVGKPLQAALFQIDPAPPGRWVWGGRNRLDYVLDRPLPPGRRYTMRPADDLETRTGRVLLGESRFTFQTGRLELAKCGLYTADNTHVNFELVFNQVVDPKDVLGHMKVWDGRSALMGAPAGTPGGPQPMEVAAQTTKPDKSVVLRTHRPRTGLLRIVLDPKLAGQGAELGLGQEVIHEVPVSPVFTLLTAEVPAPRFAKDITVNLNFSADLDHKQDPPKVEVRPAVEDLKVTREGRTLHLTGKFTSGLRYAATVPATVVSADGRTLGQPKSVSLEVPNRQPGLRMPMGRGILMPEGNLCVDAEAVNISGVQVSARKLYPDQVVAHLRGEGRDHTSQFLWDRKIPLDLPRNEPTKMALDLRTLLKDPRGVYVVEVASTQPRWVEDRAIVTITDLALTAKQQHDGLMVWVTSLKTGRPVAGAQVTALSVASQKLGQAATDADGIARLAVSAKDPGGALYAVTAQLGDDLSYLVPDDQQWMIDDVDQSGARGRGAYDVMLYAERGVYRPGDTVHLTGIIRDPIGQIPRSFPLSVRVTRPDGRDVAEIPAIPPKDGQGVFHVDFPTSTFDQTGLYRFRCGLPGSEEVLGDTEAYVEAFVPLRIEVKMHPTAQRFGPKDKPSVDLTARYLWDQPAAELPVTVACTYDQVPFRSATHKDFVFGDSVARRVTPPDAKATLDKDGHAKIDLPDPEAPAAPHPQAEVPFPIRAAEAGEAHPPEPGAVETTSPPKDKQAPSLWRVTVSGTVTETGGRSVSANTTLVVDKLDRHVGLRLSQQRVVAAGAPLEVDWVRLTGEDRPAPPGQMRLSLVRVEHDWVLQEVNHQMVWRSVERVIPVEKHEIPAGAAAGGLQVTCQQPGTHRLELQDAQTGSATRVEVYATDTAAGPETIPMNRPERLEVLLDKKEYAPGTQAKVVVRSPLSGTALVTLETDEVLATRVVPVEKNSAEVTFDLPKTLRGGAFVTATVVRAIDPSREKWLPHRAMGMARLSTTHEDHRLDVKLAAPDAARPGDRVTVTVDAGSCLDPGRPGVVHLWAVDDGILLTTDYQTPDPLGHFFAPRGLGVSTSDLFGRLLPDIRRPKSIARIGADGGEGPQGGALRRNPVPTELREPAVFWQAAIPLQPDGRATTTMPMPEITGRMRLMAVAVDHDRYGSAARNITLTLPILLEASWPRFAAPGDEFDVPVKLFNSTARPVAVVLKLTATGPIQIAARGDERILIEPHRPALVWLRAQATGMGPVQVRVEAQEVSDSPQRLTAVAKAFFPVRPATALGATADVQRIAAGQTVVLPPPGEFVPGTCTRTIHVSGKPSVELTPAIERLLQYPYGCVEQTTSSLYPLLYAADLIARVMPQDVRADHAMNIVDSGIARLWSMQTPSGGLAYWPGQREPSLWGTAYAAGFLLEAKAAGYRVDPRFVKELMRYLDQTLGEDQGLDPNVRALICRVLATFGQPRHGWMARLGERLDHLDLAGRANLAGAYLAIGRKDLAQAALPKDTIALAVPRSTGGRITSQTRQLAVLLNVLLDLDAEHEWIPEIVRRLEKARKGGCWGSTLENASVLAALSRYQVLSDHPQSFSGTIQAGKAKPVSFDQAKPASVTFQDGDGPVQIATQGDGHVYVTAMAKGLLRPELLEPYDRNLIVRRVWTDRQGRPIDPKMLRVGDLVHVQVTLTLPNGSPDSQVQNVAIVDALPGGLEVENPRLVSSAAVATQPPPPAVPVPMPVEGTPELLVPPSPGPQPEGNVLVNPADRVEFLDDRVILFSSASRDRRVFHYALRVTTAGEFALPPIQASCMYADTIASLGAPGRVTVQR